MFKISEHSLQWEFDGEEQPEQTFTGDIQTSGKKHINGNYSGGNMFRGRIYNVKLGDEDKWVNDFVPCKRTRDGAVGYFDKVTNRFIKADVYAPIFDMDLEYGEATGNVYTGIEIENGVLQYQKSYYRDIGQDVQFKCAGGKQIGETPAVKNLLTHSESKFVETSDAWFDGHQYKCVVDTGDILKYENEYWVAESLQQEEIYTPQEHSIWKIAIKKVYGVE